MGVKVIAVVSVAALGLATATASAQAPGTPGFKNDYPTVVIADYVFGCMKANGETRDALSRCSCSIDVVASLVPYKTYETAETFLSLGQITGENGALFRSTEQSKSAIAALRNAQVEADLRCF